MKPGRVTLGARSVAWARPTIAAVLLPAIVACGGQSTQRGGDGGGDDDNGGTSGGGSNGKGGSSGKGGSTGRGGTSGSDGGGGSATGGSSNAAVHRIRQDSVNKIDLLFMIDNSISMAHKQSVLADAVPVLVQRLVDPLCIDANGNPSGGTTSAGCSAGTQPEFSPLQDIHIGIITSSLGDHGGEVCVPNPAEMPPRTLNDSAQLVASVRSGTYSYQNQGFLVWDPRTERPAPDPHPGVSAHETSASDFVADFASHIQAAGERGCGYEASLEAWYRFLIDPEPINQVTIFNNVNQRGPVNQVVLQQRQAFLRPDSVLAIVMLTDENDCSINDDNGTQGWLVGRRVAMPRSSDACQHPENPDAARCCIPCVLIGTGAEPEGCNYDGDASCALGASLSPTEDSVNLRCFDQKRRFGIELLYPWERYVDGLSAMRVKRQDGTEVPNPIYTPGVDGTPARTPSRVFLAGILGVPWQDLADDASLTGRGLTYLTASEMHATAPNRWDVILGDPDTGRLPLDPHMIESIDERPAGAPNPVPGVSAAIVPSNASGGGNPINGHEQSIVGRDDLQYACIFDLVPDVPCGMANQDGCDCNASEQAYNRPTCAYGEGSGADGVQTHAKAYPSLRQLQVLRGFGDNAVVASICPKNLTALDDASSDPDYGYNPAVAALVGRFREAFGPPCFPRPLSTDNGRVSCDVVEARLPDAQGCSCDQPGRVSIASNSSLRSTIEGELAAQSQCGDATGVSCSDYCLCEIEQLAGDALSTCQNMPDDPGNLHYGFCYVDENVGDPSLVASCPASQRQVVRFMGNDVPAPRALAFVYCPQN